uniref:Uncharacterized protein n=1 Tax=Sphaerodactylus townsendi TaxID=933632 RepID=A0ACB8G061_9SAUR
MAHHLKKLQERFLKEGFPSPDDIFFSQATTEQPQGLKKTGGLRQLSCQVLPAKSQSHAVSLGTSLEHQPSTKTIPSQSKESLGSLELRVLSVHFPSGSNSVPSQPPSATVAPGNTVQLSCHGISGYVHWYQEEQGNPPRFLLHYKSDSDKLHGSGVPSRFSASKDKSGIAGYLTITGALAEDEADYYCSSWDGSAQSQ